MCVNTTDNLMVECKDIHLQDMWVCCHLQCLFSELCHITTCQCHIISEFSLLPPKLWNDTMSVPSRVKTPELQCSLSKRNFKQKLLDTDAKIFPSPSPWNPGDQIKLQIMFCTIFQNLPIEQFLEISRTIWCDTAPLIDDFHSQYHFCTLQFLSFVLFN